MPLENSYQDLLGRLLDDTLDETGRAQLIEALQADPALLRDTETHLGISEALSRLRPDRSDEMFLGTTIRHVMVLGHETENAFVSRVTRRIDRRRIIARFSIAAALVLCSTASFLVYQRHTATARLSFAHMIELDEHGLVVGRHEIKAGFRHVANHGLFQLNFDNGAIVAIEGPADFEIVSPKEMHLAAGHLNAWCPKPAHGFKVVTATGTVTDLGTIFGVSTTKNGASDFLVLNGLIEVSQGNQTRRLDEGKAVRTDHSPGIRELEFQTADFARTWPLATGILSTRGSVSAAPPGTPEQLSKLENDTSVLVIPEKRNVPFGQPITAEITEPGSFSAANATQLKTLPPDPASHLRSYLVRYNPVYNIDFRRFEGEVTFDRPVIAICCQGKYLEASDPTFATGNWTDSSPKAKEYRGIDLDQPQKYPDAVRLSSDRHTVHVVFYAGISTDDIRVIVGEN